MDPFVNPFAQEKSMPDLAIFLMDLRGGGAEKVMLNLAEGFAKRGLKVDLILVQELGEYLSQIPPNVNLIQLKSTRLVASLPQLVQYLKQSQPKVLLTALEDTNMIAIVAKLITGGTTQVIVTTHNDLRQEAQHSARLKRRWVPHLLRWFYPSADAVVGVSKGVVKSLLHFGAPTQRTHVIYNPIVTETLLTQINQPIQHGWFLPDQPPVVLGVGRLDQQKDFATLIQAFVLVRKQRSARLMILGEGKARSQLETLIQQLDLQDDVLLPGFLPNPYAYMAQASLLVMSSIWEGFGNVLVEAMAAGTSVVSTDCPSGPAEILADGQYGTLVKVGDVEGMATAIAQALDAEVDSERLKRRAADFSLEQAVLRYETLFQPNEQAAPKLSEVGG